MCFYNVFWTGPTLKLAHSKYIICFFTNVILQRFSPDDLLNKFIANLIIWGQLFDTPQNTNLVCDYLYLLCFENVKHTVWQIPSTYKVSLPLKFQGTKNEVLQAYKFKNYTARSKLVRIWAKISPYEQSKKNIPIFNENKNDMFKRIFYEL